jgi:elongation factor 3
LFVDIRPGELLEKSTRVLTEEEKAVLDQDWAGRDGSKRKLEVCVFIDLKTSFLSVCRV